LDDFAGYSDAEIETIGALLCEKRQTPRDTALGGEEGAKEEKFKLDDDNSQLLPEMTTLCLSGLPGGLIDNFGKLQKSLEWQCTGRCRAQIALIVQALHFCSMKVSCSVIARAFGKLKGL
jgi:hypothetical protein